MKEIPMVDRVNETERVVAFFRHSKANYAAYDRIMTGENPEAPYDPRKDQDGIQSDLPEKGKEMARTAASEYLKSLDPTEHTLFFASSSELRALETARIYLDTAKEMGFQIIENTRTVASDPVQRESGESVATAAEGAQSSVERIGEGMIREVKALSLRRIQNTLVSSVFNPSAYLPKGINWDAVSDETKEKWKAARVIIDSDDRGSWGANFFTHSEAIKRIFPEEKYGMESAGDLFDRDFPNLLKLIRFASRKIEENRTNGKSKKIQVLAFGHENYFSSALDAYLQNHAIPNCGYIEFSLGEEDEMLMVKDGKEAVVRS